MKYSSTDLKQYGNIIVGAVRTEQEGQRMRYVKCKGICIGLDNKYYAIWQYLLAKTMRPGGKSTSFLTEIKATI